MCSLENQILCKGKNCILRPENLPVYPISTTHEDTIMPKKIWNFFRKSARPKADILLPLDSLNQVDIFVRPYTILVILIRSIFNFLLVAQYKVTYKC